MRLPLLAGLKVLEVGDRVSVAVCGKVLSDMGAEVLMIEPPVAGNSIRRLPPYYEDTPGANRSALHAWLNNSKKSVTLRLERNEGQEILSRLVRQADILVHGPSENGSSPSHDLDYAQLKAIHPGLAVTSITPFGRRGPYVDLSSSELTLFAMSGVAHALACPVADPASLPPRKNPSHQVGIVTGLLAASATLWGLFAGEADGDRPIVDVSEWEAMTHVLFEQIAVYCGGPLVDRKADSGVGMSVAGGSVWCLPCSDGWVLISPREDHQFKRWAEVMGNPEWTTRPEMATAALRKKNVWDVYERCAAWTKTRKKSDVFRAAQANKVPAFPVALLSDLPELDQLGHRGFWSRLDEPEMPDLIYPGLPFRTDLDPLPSDPAPRVGQHAVEILRQLGFSMDEIKMYWELGEI